MTIKGNVLRNNYSPMPKGGTFGLPECTSGVEMPKCKPPKQDKNPIYTNGKTDLIDDASEYYPVEQFRGAMRWSIDGYSRRAGKKGEYLDEVRKIADYANRWLAFEQKLYDEATDYRAGGTE